jgi:hypothetical protein
MQNGFAIYTHRSASIRPIEAAGTGKVLQKQGLWALSHDSISVNQSTRDEVNFVAAKGKAASNLLW